MVTGMRRILPTLAAVAALAGAGLVAPATASGEPLVGACYAYPVATLKQVASTEPSVACTGKHTAETFLVAGLPEAFGVPSKAPVAARIAAAQPCTVKAMNAYLGLADRRLPSRFTPVALFPTNEQWKAGERWMRCDVVLQGGTSLVTLTRPVAEFVTATPPEQFDFCTPGTPNATKTAAYPCNQPKRNWIKVLQKDLGAAGSRFPGTKSVENRTRALCKVQGKQWNGAEKYPGWWAIWPTAKGWREGRRAAQCFVPYSQYQQELAARAPAPTETPAPTP